MRDLLVYLDARLAEGGTWASLAAALLALHLKLDPGLWKDVSFYGMALAVALGVVLKEEGKVAPARLLGDVLAALTGALAHSAAGDAPAPAPVPAAMPASGPATATAGG